MTSLDRVIQTCEAASDYEITRAEAMQIIAGMFSDLTSAMTFGFIMFIVGTLGIAVTKSFASNPKEGTCYEDTWRFLIKQEEGELVHGSVESKGRRINHAWVELPTGFVWEPESRGFIRLEDFRKALKPQPYNRYSVEEAAIIAARVGNLGPWTVEERMRWLGHSSPTTAEEALTEATEFVNKKLDLSIKPSLEIETEPTAEYVAIRIPKQERIIAHPKFLPSDKAGQKTVFIHEVSEIAYEKKGFERPHFQAGEFTDKYWKEAGGKNPSAIHDELIKKGYYYGKSSPLNIEEMLSGEYYGEGAIW